MIIKSSKHSLKFTNKGKTDILKQIFIDYEVCLKEYIRMIKRGELPLKKMISSKLLPITSLEQSKWRRVCYEHASSIIRSNIKHVQNRTFRRYKKVYKYFFDRGRQVKFTSKVYSQLNINYIKRTDTTIVQINLPMASDMLDIQQGKLFDNFIRITTPYRNYDTKNRYQTISIPIKEHKHSLKLLSQGYIRKGFIQLSRRYKDDIHLSFVYEKIEPSKKSSGNNIAFDSGYKKLLSDSNGNHYGQYLNDIYSKLVNKKRGSKNYYQLLQHKKNEINRVVNSLNFSNILNVVVEDLKQVKHKSKLGKKLNNKMQYWSYRQVRSKLEDRALQEGFYVVTVNPAYTSQTCSNCGKVNKLNRQGEIYSCSCGLLMDADTNAAINILHRGAYSPSSKENL